MPTTDNFGVSNAILLGGANFGQTSIKCCDLASNDESPLPCSGANLISSMKAWE